MERELTVTLRQLAVLGVLVLLVGALIFYVQARPAADMRSFDVPPGSGSADRSGPSSSSTLAPSPSRTDAPTPETGPGVDAPGTLLTARVDDGDSLDVSETLRASTPVSTLIIGPADVRAAGTQVAAASPSLVALQLRADGKEVPISTDTVRAPLRVTLTTPATTIEARYMLEGAIVRTLPSRPGRALAALGPAVRADTDAETPVVFVASGDEILGLSCPARGAVDFACAQGQVGQLTVGEPLARAQALVLLQISLPNP